MELLTIITMLALMEFAYFGLKVGGARGKFDVKAPATTGHEVFDRYYRVHYNTMEQLILFIPSLWAFGYFVGNLWAAGLGVIFIVGRLLYGLSYIKDPSSRGPGMLMSILPCYVMILGAVIGAVISYFNISFS
ncbi:MAG: glutathione S-transferase [Candidatus Azotimanducaceae bacterium]|jgi:glutathione S-transferase